VTTDLTRAPARSQPRPRTLGGVVRAFAALAALLALLAGVPAALLLLGSQLPVDVSALTPEALLRPDDGRLLVLFLLAVGWLAWASFAGSVVVEIVSTCRRVPLPGPPALRATQPMAAVLIAAIATLIAPTAATTARAEPPGPLFVATAPSQLTATPAERPAVATNSAVRVTAEPDRLPTVTVERHDTLWDLAERHLGDGARYGEILQLNRDRPQPDGRRLQSPSRLYPGWVLRLPADAHVTTDRPDTADVHVVERGDTLWEIAGEHLGDGARYPEVYAENVGDPQPDGRRLTDPDLIHPGWRIAIPDTEPPAQPAPGAETPATPVPAGPAEPAESTGPSGQPSLSAPPAALGRPAPVEEPAPAGTPSPPQSGSADEADVVVDVPFVEPDDPAIDAGLVALGIGGVALVGFLTELGRRRRHQQRVRRGSERIAMPGPDAAKVEHAARVLADWSSADLLTTSLRALAESARLEQRPVPDVRLAHLGRDRLRLTVTGGEPPLAPFRSDQDGTWDLDPALLGGCPTADVDPYPALLTIGSSGDELVLLNLENGGTLAVTGPDGKAIGEVLRAYAADLALTPSPATLLFDEVLPDLVGTLDAGRVTMARSPAHLDATEREHVRLVAAALAETQGGIRRARITLDSELVTGCLVTVTGQPCSSDGPTGWSGAAHVYAGPAVGDATTMAIHDDATTGTLTPDGITVTLPRLKPAALGGIVDVLEVSDRPAVPKPDPSPHAAADVPPVDVETWPGPRARLLGRVEIDNVAGTTNEQRIPRFTEVVAYLALHPGATSEEIAEAIWGGRRVEPATRRQLISRTRSWLGSDNDGRRYLESMPGGAADRLRLSAGVLVDWHRFQALADHGLTLGGQDGLTELDAALALVRGRPFLGIDPSRYTWAEPHIQAMLTSIVTVAETAARAHLDRGEPRIARTQALLGLTVEPIAEDLATLAEQACLAAHDLDGARRVRENLRRELDDLNDEPPEPSDKAPALTNYPAQAVPSSRISS
jgi:nucleoid-associated protein YgaU